MFRKIYLTFFSTQLLLQLQAQKEVSFESLKLNSSPAYVLLGVEPDNIQRPGSPTKFISGLQNAVVNGKLQPNVAFEFTPYYWKHPQGVDSIRFRPVEYLVQSKSVFNNIFRTMSFSLATSQSDTVVFGALKPGTGIATGVRFMLAQGKPKRGNIKLLQEWNDISAKKLIVNDLISAIQSMDTKAELKAFLQSETAGWKNNILKDPLLSYTYVSDFMDDILDALQKEVSFGSSSTEVISNYLQAKYNIYKSQAEKKLAEINTHNLPFTKTGFILEFAAGQAFVFQENSFKQTKHAKTSLWLTPSWRWELKSKDDKVQLFDFIGVLRYTFNNQKDVVDISNYFDAGAKLQYTNNNFSLSGEWIYRLATELPESFTKKYTTRWSTAIDYKISDLVTFQFRFGGNFNGNTLTYTNPKEMFALGGLNLGLFNNLKKAAN